TISVFPTVKLWLNCTSSKIMYKAIAKGKMPNKYGLIMVTNKYCPACLDLYTFLEAKKIAEIATTNPTKSYNRISIMTTSCAGSILSMNTNKLPINKNTPTIKALQYMVLVEKIHWHLFLA